MRQQVFLADDVLTAAKNRISSIFDEFENICVSVSGGKDSTVLAHLVLSKAKELNRKVTVFYLDEEVEYQATIDQINYLLFDMFPEVSIPIWWQIPLTLANATSLMEGIFVCWEEGKEHLWMRPKDSRAVHSYPYAEKIVKNKKHGFGVMDAFANFDNHQPNTCILLGLRAVENPSRFHATTCNAGYKDWLWTTALKNGSVTAYPIFDWQFGDVWAYIAKNNIRYNKIYDYMWRRGLNLQEFRVSSLIHEKAFRSLVELPEFEPETFDRLIKRTQGIPFAYLYGKDRKGLKAWELPRGFATWIEYRDFLLETYPDKTGAQIFRERFKNQPNNNVVARQQCRQLILNDLKNNLFVHKTKIKTKEAVSKWSKLL